MPHSLPFKNVVLIADLLRSGASVPHHHRRDLEQTDPHNIKELIEAITSLGVDVHHYEHPKELAEHAEQHKDDVVLSVYGGAVSRNRMALVPAVCETFGLTYVGPDVYGRIICQDKEVSKAIADQAGLQTPSHRIVRSEEDLPRVQDFPLPYVVKPLWEGSSIGIGPDSLVHLREAGEALLRDLFRHLNQPIMVEAFIPGREVSRCFIEGSEETQLRSFAEVLWNNDPRYFDLHLYDAQHKLHAENNKIVRNIESELIAEDNDAIERLLKLMSPLGYGRVDGKLWNGEFVFLEMTPDAWLGSTGTFASGFLQEGLSFPEVIRRLLLSAKTSRPDQ